jgi:hypothetical protein
MPKVSLFTFFFVYAAQLCKQPVKNNSMPNVIFFDCEVLGIAFLKVNPSKFRFIETLCHAAILNFCANLTRGKTLSGSVNKLFISVQPTVFLDHVLPLVELAQKFKKAVSMKRNFEGFTFKWDKLHIFLWIEELLYYREHSIKSCLMSLKCRVFLTGVPI